MTISLKGTKEEDLDFVLATERHPSNSPYIGQWSREEHLQLVKSANRHILIMANDVRVGYLILKGFEKKVIELTRIAMNVKGKGYGRQAIQMVKKFVFEESGFHRLWLDVIDGNDRAIKLYESEGFFHEGTLRQAEYFEGKYHDSHLYAIISDDFNQD